jgi:glycosyltransferase involved in cell wall biosynthesis
LNTPAPGSEGSVELSVVVPVYGCADCLDALNGRIADACRKVTDRYEVVYVDDRSPDSAWEALRKHSSDPHVGGIRLTRNFGQQAAITAGLEHARGRWTVVIDCDLEDPPELIPELWRVAHEGHDVVIARRNRPKRGLRRRIASSLYFWALKTFLGTNIDPSYGSFSILSDRARAAFLRVRDTDRHYIPIVLWIGFDQGQIDYWPEKRFAGESSYGFGGLARVALEGIFFQTATLLRYVVYLGFGVTAIGFLLAAFYIYSYLANDTPPGFTTIAVLVTCLSGFIIVSLGVTGLYVGRIFQQVKPRPLYLVDERIESSPAPERASDLEEAR